MIEKWDGEAPSEKWRDNLISELEDKRYETEDGDTMYLEMDPFDDVMDIKVEGSKFVFTLCEALYMTTAMREENIAFLKRFFSEEMPYLSFEKELTVGKNIFKMEFRINGD